MVNSPKSISPQAAYAALVAEGRLREDPAQAQVAGALQALHEQLAANARRRLLSRKISPRSLYIWGEVGRGKSMLMDLFFESAPVKSKRRVHFHRFMQDVHAAIHAIRKSKAHDPVAVFAQTLQSEVRLLCFDELQATDVADASLLHRLFEMLLDAGVTVVTTSNHPPENLYTGGVQRERFDKFIQLIRARMDVSALTSPTDYRTQQLRSLTQTYFSPLGTEADQFITAVTARLGDGLPPHVLRVPVHGREVVLAEVEEGVGQTSFQALCETPLGPADYLAIAEKLETLILTGIPILTPEKRNEAKRFVTLIDALYENRVKLIVTAAAPPAALYPEGDGSFEFQRTVSRLMEMQSAAWLA